MSNCRCILKTPQRAPNLDPQAPHQGLTNVVRKVSENPNCLRILNTPRAPNSHPQGLKTSRRPCLVANRATLPQKWPTFPRNVADSCELTDTAEQHQGLKNVVRKVSQNPTCLWTPQTPHRASNPHSHAPNQGLKNVVRKVSENPNCLRIGTQPGQAETFVAWNEVSPQNMLLKP